jgi:hypothetical protein
MGASGSKKVEIMNLKKGQYFSFDAIIATVIMVIAITSLVGYWVSTQNVMDSRANPLYPNALRVAESLLSPGVPENWDGVSFDEVRQIGLTNGFSNELDSQKVDKLKFYAAPASADYAKVGNLLRAEGNYYVVIQQTDNSSGYSYYAAIGNSSYADASEVVVAHRGAVVDDGGVKRPVQITVYIFR